MSWANSKGQRVVEHRVRLRGVRGTHLLSLLGHDRLWLGDDRLCCPPEFATPFTKARPFSFFDELLTIIGREHHHS